MKSRFLGLLFLVSYVVVFIAIAAMNMALAVVFAVVLGGLSIMVWVLVARNRARAYDPLRNYNEGLKDIVDRYSS